MVKLPRLRDERERHLLTQRQLAELSGVNRNTITSIERGTIDPRPDTIRKLAEALGVRPEVLMEPRPRR